MPADPEHRIGIVIQGRMSSRRLPGKVLTPIGGVSLLHRLVEACRQVSNVEALCVATSHEASDDPIAGHCAELGVFCHRGPLDDVAARFLGAGEALGLRAMVRLSADSPLVLPSLIEDLVGRFRSEDGCDLATNVLRRTFPSGMSVEVVRTGALAEVHSRMSIEQREHVTPYFYAHPEAFRIASLERRPLPGDVKLAVDTPEDLARVTGLIEALERPHWRYSLEQLAALLPAPAGGDA